MRKIFTYSHTDRWGRAVVFDEERKTWVMVEGTPHSMSKDGEPCCPIRKDIEFLINIPCPKIKPKDLKGIPKVNKND